MQLAHLGRTFLTMLANGRWMNHAVTIPNRESAPPRPFRHSEPAFDAGTLQDRRPPDTLIHVLELEEYHYNIYATRKAAASRKRTDNHLLGLIHAASNKLSLLFLIIAQKLNIGCEKLNAAHSSTVYILQRNGQESGLWSSQFTHQPRSMCPDQPLGPLGRPRDRSY